MSASYTYSQLTSALQDMMEDNSAEFAAYEDQIIRLGESRLIRDLDLDLFNTVVGGTFTATVNTLAKPSDLIDTNSLTYLNAGNRVPLEQRSYDYIMDYSNGAANGPPLYFAELDSSNFILGPTPDSNYTYSLQYTLRPQSITVTQTNSWMGDHVGDALFYACLIATEQFLKADERIEMWKTTYKEIVGAAKFELRRSASKDFTPLGAGPKVEA